MASKTAWTAWIWFAGAAVWWVSAALAVHYDHRTHAILSLSISALFFFAGLLRSPTVIVGEDRLSEYLVGLHRNLHAQSSGP